MDNNGVPDAFEVSKLASEEARASKDYQVKMADIQSKNAQALKKLEIEREKLAVERENMANDLQIAKINAKNRANSSKAKKK